MANFPTSIDTLTAKTDNVDDVLADHVNLLQDIVTALMTKTGVDSSAVTTSLDYLLKNASSVNPGHHHGNASLDDLAGTKLTWSGLTTGHALMASGASAASFRQVKESDLVDEGIYAKTSSNSQITGQWNFKDLLTFGLSGYGATLVLDKKEQTVTITAGAQVQVVNFFPAGVLPIGVLTRVTSQIVGSPDGFDVGSVDFPDAWGSRIATAAATSTTGENFVMSNLSWINAQSDLWLTSNGGNFTSGEVRICMFFLKLTALTS